MKDDTLRDEIAKAIYESSVDATVPDVLSWLEVGRDVQEICFQCADAVLAVIQKHGDSEKNHHVCCDFVKCSCVCHNDVPREPEAKP